MDVRVRSRHKKPSSRGNLRNVRRWTPRAREILTSARERGAEVVAMSCPLCAFNLDDRQKQAAERFPDFKPIPVLYFSQLLAISLGCPEETLRLDLHFVDPKPVLEGKGYL